MSAFDPNAATRETRFPLPLFREVRTKLDLNSDLNARNTASALLLALDVLTLTLTLCGIHGSVRFVLGIAFGLFVPGWSVVVWLKLHNTALEFALTVATSLALLTVMAQLLVTVHEWRLYGLQVATCLVCLPPLVWQSRAVWHPSYWK